MLFWQVLIGGAMAAWIESWPSNSTIQFYAPLRTESGVLPLEMECSGGVGRLDLRATLDFRDPTTVDIRGGAPCVQYEPCRLYLTITSPPCPLRVSGDAVLDIPGWASTSDGTTSTGILLEVSPSGLSPAQGPRHSLRRNLCDEWRK